MQTTQLTLPEQRYIVFVEDEAPLRDMVPRFFNRIFPADLGLELLTYTGYDALFSDPRWYPDKSVTYQIEAVWRALETSVRGALLDRNLGDTRLEGVPDHVAALDTAYFSRTLYTRQTALIESGSAPPGFVVAPRVICTGYNDNYSILDGPGVIYKAKAYDNMSDILRAVVGR
jgi:hypothetical protein